VRAIKKISSGAGKLIRYRSTVLVTEPGGYETVFEYALEGNAIRISFKTPIHSSCARTTPSARWASSSGKVRRSAGSSGHTACWGQAESRAAGACVTDHTRASRSTRSPQALVEPT
jgi:hypothetical protein